MTTLFDAPPETGDPLTELMAADLALPEPQPQKASAFDPEVIVAHISDLHLDQGRFGRLNPETGVSLAWESADRCWMYACDWAVEHQPGVFMFTGDAFANGKPSAEAQERFAAGLRKVARAGVPVVVVRGNHELLGVPSRHRDVYARFEDIPGVHVAVSPQLITLDSGLQIACVPWPRRNEILEGEDINGLTPEEVDSLISRRMDDIIDDLGEQVDPTSPTVLAGHFTVSNATLGTERRGSETLITALFNEPVVALSTLESGAWDYVALGHIHLHQQVGERVWYAGSPDRIDFSEERERKGFISAGIDSGGLDGETSQVELIETPARVMRTVRVEHSSDVSDLEPGTLVKVVLPDGERQTPLDLAEQIRAAGAHIVRTDTRPLRHRRKDSDRQVDVDTPVLDALRAWFDREEIPEPERLDMAAAAKVLIDQTPLP